MVDCGMFIVVGYGLGISTLAVVYAIKWLRSRSIVRGAITEIAKEEMVKQQKIAQAKKQIAEAKKVLEAVEEKVKEEPKEETESTDGQYVEEEPKPKPKPKKTLFKKKEEPKEEVRQSIQLE